jgi:hypothetical protein
MFIVLLIFVGFSETISQMTTIGVDLEVITKNALAGGDGGNQWGGHQCRIVHTNDGVFTVYTSGDEDHFERTWHLMKRTENGWVELASDKSGREPVNLMTDPEGMLYIIGWPEYQGTMWTGKPSDSTIHFIRETIPAVYSGSHPYNAAGIDRRGNICVVSSVDDYRGSGRFQWAYYNKKRKTWQGRITFVKFRHCYTYIFPHEDGSISLVSTRDVRWEALGYKQPENTFAYVFNAFRYWKAQSIDRPLQELAFFEEKPTPEYPFVICRAMNDVYIDHQDKMHIIYTLQGKSTNGKRCRFHAIYSQDGHLIYKNDLSARNGRFCRIFQDNLYRFFILDDTGILYHLDDKGESFEDSVLIDLKDYPVNYAGYGLTVPRTGSKLSDSMNIVYPSKEGKYYIYFKINPAVLFPSH